MIATRTKAALAAAKARGVKLGGPKLAEARELAAASIKTLADRHAAIRCPQRARHQHSARGEVVRQVSQQLARSFGLTESVSKTVAAGR
jgi:DNA invertase Pin-like site-specific DNA recombinase